MKDFLLNEAELFVADLIGMRAHYGGPLLALEELHRAADGPRLPPLIDAAVRNLIVAVTLRWAAEGGTQPSTLRPILGDLGETTSPS